MKLLKPIPLIGMCLAGVLVGYYVSQLAILLRPADFISVDLISDRGFAYPGLVIQKDNALHSFFYLDYPHESHSLIRFVSLLLVFSAVALIVLLKRSKKQKED